MVSSGRQKIEDEIINTDLVSTNFHNKHLIRIGSKEQSFTKVDFSHTYFEHCYFRKIKFDSCNFTGCKFINCNFQSCSFPGSTFDYTIFDKTFIESDILDNNCPSHNNLKLKFARTLRTNYQGLGDAVSANKAIKIELKATKKHLYEAWHSNAAYYRVKYSGWNRFFVFFEWLYFRIQDFVWGSGESPIKLIRTYLIIWFICSIIDTIFFKDPNSLKDYWHSILNFPSIFMGIYKPKNYSNGYLTFITITRFIGFALFTSILIKRFNKR